MPRNEGFAPLGPKSDAVAGARDLLQAKHRRQRGQCLVEGPDSVSAALVAGLLRAIYTSDPADQLAVDFKARGGRVYFVDQRSIAALSDTVSPQGPVGVCEIPAVAGDALTSAQLLVVCDSIADPGNLGTIIRTAAAFGADAVLVTTGSADPWSGKTLRATAGAFTQIPILTVGDAAAAVAQLKSLQMQILVTAADGKLTLGGPELTAKISTPHAWVVGSEAHGVSAELRRAATATVRISMVTGVESLNAAVAAGLCMYESVRGKADF